MMIAHTTYHSVGVIFKWFVSHTPYLVHESSITPHITSSRVLTVMESLSCMMINELSLIRINYDNYHETQVSVVHYCLIPALYLGWG